MHATYRTVRGLPEPAPERHAPTTATIFVDCVDGPRRDLLVFWLTHAGYRVHEGSPLQAKPGPHADVLLTDRFGPGRSGADTIFELKAKQPGLCVVVIGCGDDSEAAQLSLARAVGADLTLPAVFDRARLLQLVAACG